MFEQRPGAVIRHGSEVRLAGGRRLGTGQAGGVSELEGRELAQDGSFSVWSDGGRSHHTRRRPPPTGCMGAELHDDRPTGRHWQEKDRVNLTRMKRNGRHDCMKVFLRRNFFCWFIVSVDIQIFSRIVCRHLLKSKDKSRLLQFIYLHLNSFLFL